MNKQLIISCCFMVACFNLMAQQPVKRPLFVTTGIDALIPNAEFGETHRAGIGATIEGGYRTGRYFAPVLTFSYYSLPADRNTAFKDLNAVSVKAGGRLYLSNFYMVGEGGALIANGYTNATKFIYTAGIGDEIRINQRMKIDFGVRYEAFNTGRANGMISIKGGLTYLLGN